MKQKEPKINSVGPPGVGKMKIKRAGEGGGVKLEMKETLMNKVKDNEPLPPTSDERGRLQLQPCKQ